MMGHRTAIQMELEEAQYSNGVIQGTVVFDVLGSYKKGDFYKARYTELQPLKKHMLFKCGNRVVLIWLSPR
jgi:hypothetical protein